MERGASMSAALLQVDELGVPYGPVRVPDGGALTGGTASPGRSMLSEAGQGGIDRRVGDITWSTRLGAERFVGLDMRSETTIRTDGQAAVKATPVFDGPSDTVVKLDLIQGSGE